MTSAGGEPRTMGRGRWVGNCGILFELRAAVRFIKPQAWLI